MAHQSMYSRHASGQSPGSVHQSSERHPTREPSLPNKTHRPGRGNNKSAHLFIYLFIFCFIFIIFYIHITKPQRR